MCVRVRVRGCLCYKRTGDGYAVFQKAVFTGFHLFSLVNH